MQMLDLPAGCLAYLAINIRLSDPELTQTTRLSQPCMWLPRQESRLLAKCFHETYLMLRTADLRVLFTSFRDQSLAKWDLGIFYHNRCEAVKVTNNLKKIQTSFSTQECYLTFWIILIQNDNGFTVAQRWSGGELHSEQVIRASSTSSV